VILVAKHLLNVKATIDHLEDFEYSSDVNSRLGFRYNYSPQINLTPLKGGGSSGITSSYERKTQIHQAIKSKPNQILFGGENNVP
jgi:hypothetical protein